MLFFEDFEITTHNANFEIDLKNWNSFMNANLGGSCSVIKVIVEVDYYSLVLAMRLM